MYNLFYSMAKDINVVYVFIEKHLEGSIMEHKLHSVRSSHYDRSFPYFYFHHLTCVFIYSTVPLKPPP